MCRRLLKSRRLRSVVLLAVSPALAASDFSVVRYGAVADGTTDSTRAIQSAVDAAARAGGGTVDFPAAPAPYVVRGTITIENSGIEVSGRGARLLLASGALNGKAAPLILFTGTGQAPIRGVALRGLSVDANYFDQVGAKASKAVVLKFVEDAVIEDVVITRPYVGLSIRRSTGVVARRVTVSDYEEDGFDAGGDADEVPGGQTRGVTFIDVVARDAPRCAHDGNAFEIEDGADGVLIQDALVENVAGNGAGLRNHNSKDNHSRDVELRNVTLRGIGGAYAVFVRSAATPDNSYRDVRLVNVTADAPVALWGPIRKLSVQGGRFTALLLGFDSLEGPPTGAMALSDAVLRDSRAGLIRINGLSERISMSGTTAEHIEVVRPNSHPNDR